MKGAEKVFYGLDDIANSKTVIIVEGEMDKLAMEEAGYLNCVSVPGARSLRVGKAANLLGSHQTRYRSTLPVAHSCAFFPRHVTTSK